jgi:hypothetical protein
MKYLRMYSDGWYIINDLSSQKRALELLDDECPTTQGTSSRAALKINGLP